MRIPRIGALGALVLLILPATGCETYELESVGTVYLNTELGHPSGGNSLKLFDVAADSEAGKVYVHSILSRHIAVLDAETGRLEKYLDSGLTDYHISYLAVRKSSGKLFVADQKSLKLVKIDPETGKVTDSVTLPSTPTKIAVVDDGGYVCVAFASRDEIRAYSTEDLSLAKTLSSGVYGPQGMVAKDGKLYVALSRDRSSSYSGTASSDTYSAVAVVDPGNGWSVSRLSVRYSGASEIAVDATNGRYWLLSEGRLRFAGSSGAFASRSSGGVEYQMVAYSKSLDRVILLTRDGGDSTDEASPFGTVEILDPETLETERTYRVGVKPSRMAFVGDLDRVFTANMGDGSVSLVDLSTSEDAGSTDIGTSIEDLAVHPDGGKVYLLDRLGGSQVHLYDRAGDSVKSIDVSPWPTRLGSDPDRREIYVLSHYAAAIDVIDADTNRVSATIDMTASGMPQARTHFLSDLAYDRGRGRAFAAFPEHGKIAEVNVETRKVRQVVDAFDAVTEDEDSGGHETGRAQLEVDPVSHRLFVYYRDEHELEVRDPDKGLAVTQTLSVSSSAFSGNDYEALLLTVDATGRRLFVGNRVYTISGGTLSYATTISGIEKVVGIDDDYLVAASMGSDKSVKAYAYEIKSSTSFSKKMEASLTSAESLAPRLAIDLSESILYSGYMERAKLRIYRLDEKD